MQRSTFLRSLVAAPAAAVAAVAAKAAPPLPDTTAVFTLGTGSWTSYYDTGNSDMPMLKTTYNAPTGEPRWIFNADGTCFVHNTVTDRVTLL